MSRALAELDSQVAGLEGEISESNHDGAALNLGRLQGLIERGRGLGGVLTERRRSLLAVMQSLVDEGLIPALEAELSKLDVELQAVEVEARALMGRSDELARAEAAVALDQEAFRSRFEGPDLVSGADPSQAGSPGRSAAMAVTSPAQGQAAAQAAAQARSNIESLRHSLERDLEGVERLAARQAELVARQAQIQAEAVAATDEAVRVEEEGAAITQRSQASSQALARAIEIVHMGEAEFSAADGEAHRWEARTEALALALDQVRARAGAERLADVTDVVGTLADLVKVDAGWEAAFEAAVGEAALAVVVGGAQEARASLGHLASTGESGSVLALALGPTHPERRPAAAAVRGGRAVRDHVSSPHPGVGQLLDRLLDRAVVVDGSWPEAIDIHLRHPEMVVVTRGGDRVSTWSWRIGTAGPGATGAALEEAKAAGVVAGQRRQAARVALDQARSELVACQEAVSNMTRAKLQNEARAQANKVGIQRHRADAEAIRDQMGKLLVERGELAERMGRDQAKLDQLCGLLPGLEAEEAEEANRRAQVHDARRRLEERVAAVAALRTEFEVMAAGLGERRAILGQRRAEVSQQLGRNRSRREEARSKRLEHEHALGVVDSLAAWLGKRMAFLESEVSSLDAELGEASDQARLRTTRLEELRRSRAESERLLSGARERIQRAEIEEAENRLRYEAASDVVRRELDVEPEAAINAVVPELSAGQSAAGRSRELERELRLMGPINPLALEELEALTERHQFLQSQMEDVRNSRRELFKVIRAIDTEIVDVFASAYEDVAENFSQLFATLFPGGAGRLSLTQPENLLETGIDVDARPAGKNVRKLSLLSGGERSLVAMAFLFAVFRSRPSPFYLMDEVEAALDDVNLHRFLGLVHEFRSEAQLVIVSHQKRTMEAADSLIGVSMQPGETSKVVSEKLQASA
ncbi:MAG: coiled-coil domain-containing protein [Acidimicrobiales bacterium]